MKFKRIFSLFILFAIPVFAQTAETNDFPSSYYDLLGIGLILTLAAIIIAFLIFGMGERVSRERVKKEDSALLKLRRSFSGLTPLEKEQEIMLAHDYDGIRELDNRIPPWFSYLFYATILFAVYYMLDYHVFNTGVLPSEEYAEEIRNADILKAELIKTGALINEESVTALLNPDELSSGRKVFAANCVVCHSADGGGLVGPNLTDDYWINGAGMKNIFKTVKYGVPNKGMISWQQQLNPRQMQEVASYILTLRGTKPLNPKQPEGTLYTDIDSTRSISSKD